MRLGLVCDNSRNSIWVSLTYVFFVFFILIGIAQAKRIHVVAIASHSGDNSEVPLLFSERDARRVASVFGELGGVEPADSIVLVDPDSDRISQTFKTLSNGRVRPGDELIVYVSSHMDAQSFHIGVEHFEFTKLFKMAADTGASFKIFILDGCRSGSVTTKGLSIAGKVRAIRPQRQVAKGELILTSTSADEDALESERLGGSFFTHYLVSGLRGAADANGDGKVSVDEILTFTHDSTVFATAGAPTGSQHPSFKIDMVGAGSTILTKPGEFSHTNATIVISQQRSAVGYLLNRDSGLLETEFSLNHRGKLVVAPGNYKLRIAGHDGVFEGDLVLAMGDVKILSQIPLSPVSLLTLLRKGQGVASRRNTVGAEVIGSMPEVNGLACPMGVRAFTNVEWRSISLSFSLSYIYSSSTNSNVEFDLHHLGLELGVNHSVHFWGVALRFGLEVDGIFWFERLRARQRGVDTQGNRYAFVFGFDPLIGVDVPLGTNLLFNLSFRGRVLFSKQQPGWFAPELAIGVGWIF